MKKLFITIIIVLISNALFSQSFYRYRDMRIDLKADSTAFVVQPNAQWVGKLNTVLEEQLQKGEIESFQKIPNNRFLVVGAKTQPETYGYFSNVYRNDENGVVIILPRIVVMLNDKATIEPILDKYEGKLIKESGSR